MATALGFVLERAYSTDCGHSGAAVAFLIPGLLWVAISVGLRRLGFPARVGILLGLSVAGATPYLDVTGVLRDYGPWIHEGMPDPPTPEWAHGVVIVYAGASVLLIVAVEAIVRRMRSGSPPSE